MQPSPVTSNPPTLPTDVRDAGDAEVAAYWETIANKHVDKRSGERKQALRRDMRILLVFFLWD